MTSENYQLYDTISIRDGFMHCENVCIKTLQEKLEVELRTGSSPVFVYSRAQILLNIGRYRQALENKGGLTYLLGYALKANYNPHIVRLVRDSACCIIAVSGHEVRLAIQENIHPERIILNGNGKHEWELELAVSSGCLVNVDSSFDLSRLKIITERLKKHASVLIRLNPDIDPDVHPFLATGLSRSKFGVEDSQLGGLLETIRALPWIRLVGLHCHLGSTIGTTQVFRECLDVMLDAVARVRKLGFDDIKYINLGGGLNIDYRKHERRTRPLRTEDADRMSTDDQYIPVPTPVDLIESIDTRRIVDSGLTLILEPGRSIVGSAGLLITKVIGCKKAGSKQYITVDGSMTEIIRPAFYGAYHHVELTEPSTSSRNNELAQGTALSVDDARDAREVFDIVGPVCECADFLAKDRLLPRPHPGCGLAVFDVGAYCSSMSSNYNMRPRAAEVLVDGDTWRVIRKPEIFEELLQGFPS